VLGQREKAADLLRLAWRNYTLPPYHLWREYSHYNFGMYITHAVRTTFNVFLSIFLVSVPSLSWQSVFPKPFQNPIMHTGCSLIQGSMLTTLYSMLGVSTTTGTGGAGLAAASAAAGSAAPDPTAAWINRNASLPAGWDAFKIERLWLGGIAYEATGVHGERMVLKPLDD
jgi:hypothetical protein